LVIAFKKSCSRDFPLSTFLLDPPVLSIMAAMPAETLNCPMCGAPAASDSTQCEHCGARLATVACPSCFGMVFVGAKFCSHCGAKVDRTDEVAAKAEACPRCHANLEAALVGTTNLRECPQCEGVWVDKDVLSQICEDKEKQAAVIGMGALAPSDAAKKWEEQVCYIPCPVCHDLMNRVNFAHCSHVVVDVCQKHGTWFDKDELRQIVEFIRAGGMEKSRQMEIQNLEHHKQELESAQSASAVDLGSYSAPRDYSDDLVDLGISAVGAVLRSLFR
jgi:Zn-finger nucleic acid-binding protein